VDIEQVHFHEVGAIDALVDIVGCCLVLHNLGVDAVYASPLPLGSGTIRTEHGLLPVPAPATLALIAEVGAPTLPLEARGELVTPTGAAILTTLATFERPAMRVQRVGYGFGTKTFPWPNMVRVWIGEALPDAGRAHWPGGANSGDATATPSHTHLHEDEAHGHQGSHKHGHDHAHEHGHTHSPEDTAHDVRP
jgi:uncharacterized protein (DUF111 family)